MVPAAAMTSVAAVLLTMMNQVHPVPAPLVDPVQEVAEDPAVVAALQLSHRQAPAPKAGNAAIGDYVGKMYSPESVIELIIAIKFLLKTHRQSSHPFPNRMKKVPANRQPLLLLRRYVLPALNAA